MKPITTEKAVMKIEAENVLTFKFDKNKTKTEIKKEVEELFDIKVKSVKTLIKGNRKYAYIKLNEKFLAIDLATKLGLM